MINMELALENYKIAVQGYLKAQKEESVSKDRLKKARYTLFIADQELKAMKSEMLEDNLRNL